MIFILVRLLKLQQQEKPYAVLIGGVYISRLSLDLSLSTLIIRSHSVSRVNLTASPSYVTKFYLKFRNAIYMKTKRINHLQTYCRTLSMR